MASSVDICNLALGHLGDEATVASLDPPDGSVQADHCAQFYPIARDQVLVAHVWGFATKRATLALLDATPPDGWLYAYSAPSNCLREVAVFLYGEQDATNGQDFDVEVDDDGNKIVYTDAANATIKYIAAITDTVKFTPGVVVAIARLLASYLAGPVIKGTEGMKVSQAQLQWYTKVDLPNATAQDAKARKSNPYTTFTPEAIKARA